MISFFVRRRDFISSTQTTSTSGWTPWDTLDFPRSACSVCLILPIVCDRIWEKDHITHFLNFRFKNAYNVESIAVTDFYFGVMILISSCYTHKEFRATPTSGLGASARVDHFQKSPFKPHFGSSQYSTGGLLQLLALDLWSRSPKLQVGSLGLLGPLNDDRLKNSKTLCFAQYGPFSLISYNIFKRQCFVLQRYNSHCGCKVSNVSVSVWCLCMEQWLAPSPLQ